MTVVLRKITKKQGLPPVKDYEGWPPNLAEKQELLKKEITEAVTEHTNGARVFFADPENCFCYRGQYGFSFGISKFDKNFHVTLGNNEFRYKSQEVFNAIAEIIKRHDWLSTKYKWDAGFGVFVFNIFMEDEQ